MDKSKQQSNELVLIYPCLYNIFVVFLKILENFWFSTELAAPHPDKALTFSP